MSIEVGVWLSMDGVDVRAGRLYSQRRRNAESATFIYDEGYLALPGAYELDPALPLRTGAHHTPVDLPLFNAMRDTSPDRWGRRLVERAERLRSEEADAAPRGLSEADFLLGVRDDLRQGALRFRRDLADPFLASVDTGVPALIDLPELLGAAGRVESDHAGSAEIRRLVQAGSSLGGARPKAHVRDSSGRIAIAKFPSALDTWNVMAWEKLTLDLAADAGIIVPTSELHVIADRHVLVVGRFDRIGDERRIGYVSALTMLEARDHDVRSYLEIAEVVEERSPAATAELEQLWRRIVFSVLISNTDDHLRNHGFLHDGARNWRLSPAFDINPNPAPGEKHLRTAIDDTETMASIDLTLEVAEFFRLDSRRATQVLAEVRDAAAKWRTVAAQMGLSRAEIEGMAPAFKP